MMTDIRTQNQRPDISGLVSETFPPGHTFPYENVPIADSAVWLWSVARLRIRKIDYLWDEHNYSQAVGRMENLQEYLPTWPELKNYVLWYINSNNAFIAERTRWSIDFLTSTKALNTYLAIKAPKEDTRWWKEMDRMLNERSEKLGSVVAERQQELQEHLKKSLDQARTEYADRMGISSTAVAVPFE